MNEDAVFNALKYRGYNWLLKAYVWRNSDGLLHRDGGPAIEYDNGSKSWYQNDRLHRTDGPAKEDAGGSKWWFINGERHREDGPAREEANGHKSWYINGQYLSEEEFNRRTK